MQAIWSGPHSEGWKKSGAQIYGWMNAGCYVSTSHKSRYVAPWVGEPDAKPTFNGCVIYPWQQGRHNHYACLNLLSSGKYAYNNLQSVYYTWYRKFGNSSRHTATEWWYMWEKKVPNVGPSAPAAAASLLINRANGALAIIQPRLLAPPPSKQSLTTWSGNFRSTTT